MSSRERNKVPTNRSRAPGGVPPGEDEESPGVPGFHTWRGVYVFVAVAFVAMVVALAIFSRLYA